MKKYLLLAVLAVFFVGCGPKKPIHEIPYTNAELFKPLYDANPTSILILPAVDNTTSADASELFSYTILPFLAERGYYVFSPSLVDDFLKSENITEPKMAREIPLEKIREVFNPDAILYVDINSWNTKYKVLSSGVSVGLSHIIVNAKNGDVIWREGSYVSSVAKGHLDGSSPEAFLISALISATVAAVNSGTDYQKLALEANNNTYYNMPYGKYHPNHIKNKNEIFGTLKIYESDMKMLSQEKAKNRLFEYKKSIYADKKPDGKILGNSVYLEIKTDYKGNLILKDGRPITKLVRGRQLNIKINKESNVTKVQENNITKEEIVN